MTNTLQIRYNKVFIYLISIFLIGLILIINFSKHVEDTPFVILNIGLGTLTLFIFLKFLFPTINNKIALELNNDGIYDFVRNQNTSWTNVTGITKIYFGRGQSGVGVLLADKNQFISQKTLLKRLLLKYNSFSYSTPFIILFSFLEGSNDDILKSVQNYYAEIQQQTKMI